MTQPRAEIPETFAPPSPPAGIPPIQQPRSRKRGWGGYLLFLLIVFIGLASYGYLTSPEYAVLEPSIVITGIVAVVTLPIFWLVFRRRGRGQKVVVRGLVTSMQSRQMPGKGGKGSVDVWSFRLQLTDMNYQQLLRDAQGNPSPALPVEIRAQTISGPLQDGDKAEIHGRITGGILYPMRVYNHSVGGAQLTMK